MSNLTPNNRGGHWSGPGAIVLLTRQTKINYRPISLVQIAASLPLLLQAVQDSLANSTCYIEPILKADSRQWTYPTLWSYIWNLVRLGVR